MDPIKADQMVLCIPHWRNPVKGRKDPFLAFNPAALAALAPRATFQRREFCETNEDVVQLIPYCVVRDAAREKVLLYRRPEKGGDPRLTGRHSVGVGGHVEARDWPRDAASAFSQAIFAAATRELDEELRFSVPADAWPVGGEAMLGLIHDRSDAVGRVHLGVLIEVVLAGGVTVEGGADEALEVRWATLAEAAGAPNLESWSRIALRALGESGTRIETP